MRTEVQIRVTPRTVLGKGPVRRLRAAGTLPGVLYGPHTTPRMISLDQLVFRHFLERHYGESPLVDVFMEEGGKEISKKVAIKEIQFDPVTDEAVHVDLYEFDLNKPITLPIPVHLQGTPLGVTDQGGVLQFIGRELMVKALPSDFPKFLPLDVATMVVGDTLSIKEVAGKFPQLHFEDDAEKVILSVMAKKKVVEAETPAEGAVVEGAAAPEAAKE